MKYGYPYGHLDDENADACRLSGDSCVLLTAMPFNICAETESKAQFLDGLCWLQKAILYIEIY